MLQQDIYEILCNTLDVRSGTVQAKNEEIIDKSSLLFQVWWKGNIAFSVEGWKHFGWFLVKKDGQQVSALFHYTKIDNDIIRCMQNLINEIEYGKYDNKKTQSDRIQDIIQQKQLTSYMNKTKWQELIAEIRQIDNLQIKYKTIFDTSDPEIYWTIDGDEHFDFMNKALIEWFIISGNITECEHQGRLLEPKIVQHDIKSKILNILQKYSIFYEYDEIRNLYVIYGYRWCSKEIDVENAEHYNWKTVYDGWHLLKSDELSVIAEKMPANTYEDMYYHYKARQFFYVLSGEAEIYGPKKNAICYKVGKI